MTAAKKECKEPDCISPSRKREWCESHYNLIWRRGRQEKTFDRSPNGLSIQDRLNSKSRLNKETGCIEWLRPHVLGYGHLTINKVRIGAHRLSWELFHGKSADGFLVMHACDNRRCINPNHLVLGTDALNQQDKVLKGRQAKGTDFKSTKLNENKIKEIFVLSQQGFNQKEIANQFNIHPSNISNILRRKRWKHVEVSL